MEPDHDHNNPSTVHVTMWQHLDQMEWKLVTLSRCCMSPSYILQKWLQSVVICTSVTASTEVSVVGDSEAKRWTLVQYQTHCQDNWCNNSTFLMRSLQVWRFLSQSLWGYFLCYRPTHCLRLIVLNVFFCITDNLICWHKPDVNCFLSIWGSQLWEIFKFLMQNPALCFILGWEIGHLQHWKILGVSKQLIGVYFRELVTTRAAALRTFWNLKCLETLFRKVT